MLALLKVSLRCERCVRVRRETIHLSPALINFTQTIYSLTFSLLYFVLNGGKTLGRNWSDSCFL